MVCSRWSPRLRRQARTFFNQFFNQKESSMKQNLLIRVFALGVFTCALVALVGSTLTSAGRARQSLPAIQPRVDLARNNLTIVPDDPEAIYEGARIVHNVTVDGEKGM